MFKRKPRFRKSRTDNYEQRRSSSLRERIAETVDVSKDILLNVPRIVFIGNSELTIENYIGIMEYGDCVIRVSAEPFDIKITGCKLEIRTISQDILFITGTIVGFEFSRA